MLAQHHPIEAIPAFELCEVNRKLPPELESLAQVPRGLLRDLLRAPLHANMLARRNEHRHAEAKHQTIESRSHRSLAVERPRKLALRISRRLGIVQVAANRDADGRAVLCDIGRERLEDVTDEGEMFARSDFDTGA